MIRLFGDRRSLLDSAGTLLGLILVAAIFGLLIGGQFFAPANIELMARQTAIVCTAALGMTIVIALGGIDLSVGSMISLGTVVIALLLQQGVSPIGAALGGIFAVGACGLLNGVLITQLRLVPFIITLGTMLVIRGAAKGVAEERRIEAPMTWLNDLLRTQSGQLGLPGGIWTVIALALLVAGLLRYTRFGRHVLAIGSNERMARLCGVPIAWTKIVVYALSGLLTGVAGLLQFRIAVEIPERDGALQMGDGQSAHANFPAFGWDQGGNWRGGRIGVRIFPGNRFDRLRCATSVVAVKTEAALCIELSIGPRAEN